MTTTESTTGHLLHLSGVLRGALKRSEAAAFLAMGETTLKNHEKAGDGPAFYWEGRERRYRIGALIDWMVAREAEAQRLALAEKAGLRGITGGKKR